MYIFFEDRGFRGKQVFEANRKLMDALNLQDSWEVSTNSPDNYVGICAEEQTPEANTILETANRLMHLGVYWRQVHPDWEKGFSNEVIVFDIDQELTMK